MNWRLEYSGDKQHTKEGLKKVTKNLRKKKKKDKGKRYIEKTQNCKEEDESWSEEEGKTA